MKVCILGSSGKIGTMFKSMLDGHNMYDMYLPKFLVDYSETRTSEQMNNMLLECDCVVLCHHNLKNPDNFYKLTQHIIQHINTNSIIINIASDAEILPIPFRILYGKVKKKIRYEFSTLPNRVINIFFPYVTATNVQLLTQQVHQLNWKYDYYYLSGISKLMKPCILKPTIWNDKFVTNYVKTFSKSENSLYTKITNKELYMFVHEVLENKLRIQFKQYYQLSLKTLIWQLYFKGIQGPGKNHIDMKRCLFGNMVRVIMCIHDTSDYTIRVNNQSLKLKYGDILLLPNNTYHQPLGVTYGERKLVVLDFFTSSIINPVSVLLFYIISKCKIFGFNV
jgi:hypothetical protein